MSRVSSSRNAWGSCGVLSTGTTSPVFKNDRYQGFLVFDPVDSRVRQVTVTLYDVALKFDVFGDPVESVDIPFTFNIMQGIREKAVTAMAERTAAGGSY